MDTYPGSAMPAEIIVKMKATDSYPEEKFVNMVIVSKPPAVKIGAVNIREQFAYLPDLSVYLSHLHINKLCVIDESKICKRRIKSCLMIQTK